VLFGALVLLIGVFFLSQFVFAQEPPPLSDLFSSAPAEVSLSSNDFILDAQGFSHFQKSPADIEKYNRAQAFDSMLESLLPLRPEEIRKLLEHFDRTQESVEVPVYPNPVPKVAVETISLDPGALPSVVRVASGHVTTLNFLDVSGEPWPIEDISWAGNFEVIESSMQEGSHILRISPSTEFAYGNMSIRLLGLTTPVIVTLETSRDIVHYRFDAIIPKYGPFGKTPLIEGNNSLTAGGADISAVLEGVPFSGTRRLNVSGVDGRTSAYISGDIVYVRTPFTLLSPGWSSSVSSADGMNVYKIRSAPVLILSNKGQMVRVHLSEKEDIFDE